MDYEVVEMCDGVGGMLEHSAAVVVGYTLLLGMQMPASSVTSGGSSSLHT